MQSKGIVDGELTVVTRSATWYGKRLAEVFTNSDFAIILTNDISGNGSLPMTACW